MFSWRLGSLNPRFEWYAGGGPNPYAKHPISQWRDAGLAASLSCDNITLSGAPTTRRDLAQKMSSDHDELSLHNCRGDDLSN